MYDTVCPVTHDKHPTKDECAPEYHEGMIRRMKEIETVLCPLSDVVIISDITTVDECQLCPDQSVQLIVTIVVCVFNVQLGAD